MDSAIKDVLKQYAARAEKERAQIEQGNELRVDDLLLGVGPEAAAVLTPLANGARATHILELGTSFGYSTIWLAEAAKANGGKVTTCELAKAKHDYARASLTAAGLIEQVDLR